MYVTTPKEFNLKRFLVTADFIKDEVGMFSYLKSAQRFTTAASLDTCTDELHTKFNYFLNIYETLIDNGFSRSPFSYIAASTLLRLDNDKIERYVQKTIDIYKGMKDHHLFLTNSGDYPLAAILSQREKTVEELVNKVEDYYKVLNEKGLYKGNDLQLLMSHKSSLGDAARAGLNVSIETLIQAQQAAITASITAATVASSSSGSDG